MCHSLSERISKDSTWMEDSHDHCHVVGTSSIWMGRLDVSWCANTCWTGELEYATWQHQNVLPVMIVRRKFPMQNNHQCDLPTFSIWLEVFALFSCKHGRWPYWKESLVFQTDQGKTTLSANDGRTLTSVMCHPWPLDRGKKASLAATSGLKDSVRSGWNAASSAIDWQLPGGVFCPILEQRAHAWLHFHVASDLQ